MFSERFYAVGRTFIGLQSFPVMILYLIIIGMSPLYQQLTKPCSLRRVMVIYNYFCSFCSACTLIGFITGCLSAKSVFLKDGNPILTKSFFLYWATKNLELLDTAFMILRHKRRQISFLHVYHHASMVLLTDFAYHYSPWAGIAFGLAINSFVHVCLYYYYGYTAQHPQGKPSWKPRITELQIIQFLIGLVHNTIGYLHHGFCIYSMFYGASMLYLFSSFYYNAFLRKKKVV
ncbi:very long chain fatty acid elongase 5-like [Diadema antillarum]|uniref:very long chain fatty acid elongase 5-like n=1 Tax=Diadema antillarum TaxID=105358 RepID=UPI003A89564E